MAVNTRATLLIESEGLQNESLTATRPFRVYDVNGVIVNSVASTTTVQRNGVAVSSALADNAGAANTVTRTTTIDLAQDDFAVGDVMLFSNSGAGREIVYVSIIPRPITGA